ncbi:nuclear transport factor 2 family protein [Chitinophagaceae bacterium LB-8]|uniref:Nuclear transport factor 2 family protein n=1 Tax=Paraflavisolibacter caeni TaxID=2982496 RepID=A0A9X2XYV6_9BACT|nr:nuclear transport factor 2 family protein [Paraflavisolibacter caeni]MCU7551365.1 nuclear transport factor 2 family protein [Paraflavisolibacter caeni]
MDAETLLFKLRDALNTHDIEAFVACFDENYYSEQPAHPARTFQGREQVRKNWASNFEEMPDFSAQLIRHAISHDTLWTEWEWQGTRRDTSKLFMRGVMIMGVEEGKITWGRLYVEPVEVSGKGIEGAVAEVMHGKKTS